MTSPASSPGKAAPGKPTSGKPTSGTGEASCTAAPDTRSAAWTGGELAFPLREMCYK